MKIKNDNNEPSVVELLGKVVTFNADHFKDAALNFGEVKSIVKGVLKRRAKLLNNGHNTNLTNKTIINYLDLTNKGQSGMKKQIESIKKDTADKTKSLKDKQTPGAENKDVKPVISGTQAPSIKAPTKSVNNIGR